MAGRTVEFRNVSFTTPGGHCILRDVSLTVAAGETVALLGRSGSGKTTLLRTVNALIRPTSGAVLVGADDVSVADVVALRRGIGYVVQEGGLFPHWTIARNIAASLELAGIDEAARVSRARAWLEQVGLDPALSDRYPRQLSGGQRQRVGVARALAGEPGVLLMDEPFGALDPLTRSEMQNMLRNLLRRVETTALLVTHDLDEALFLAARIVLMERGEIVSEERGQTLLSSPNPAFRRYVEAAHRARLSA